MDDGTARAFLFHYRAVGPRVEVCIEPTDWTLGILNQLAAPGVMLTDESGTIVHHNTALLRLLDLPSAGLMGQRVASVAERVAAHAGDGENVFRVTLDGRPMGDVLRIRDPGGRERDLRVQGSTWRYQGLRCGSIWLVFDATEDFEERRQAAMAIWYRLGAMFEHELRNPLQTMQAAAQVIRPTLPADKVRVLDLLEEQVRLIGEHIGDLLQAPPSGGLTPGRVSDAVRATISGAATRASTRHLVFDHRRLEDEPLVRLHLPSLGRVFSNLFRNSAQARRDATVRISYAVEGDILACTVADNGPGFPIGMVARSLIPGERDPAQHLGLLIVASTVEAHGGAATMSNAEHGGASVVIRLPVATESHRLPQGPDSIAELGARARRGAPTPAARPPHPRQEEAGWQGTRIGG